MPRTQSHLPFGHPDASDGHLPMSRVVLAHDERIAPSRRLCVAKSFPKANGGRVAPPREVPSAVVGEADEGRR
jgi:hypothetical protein